MIQPIELLRKKVFQVDGLTLTVGGIVVVLVLVWLYMRLRK